MEALNYLLDLVKRLSEDAKLGEVCQDRKCVGQGEACRKRRERGWRLKRKKGWEWEWKSEVKKKMRTWGQKHKWRDKPYQYSLSSETGGNAAENWWNSYLINAFSILSRTFTRREEVGMAAGFWKNDGWGWIKSGAGRLITADPNMQGCSGTVLLGGILPMTRLEVSLIL